MPNTTIGHLFFLFMNKFIFQKSVFRKTQDSGNKVEASLSDSMKGNAESEAGRHTYRNYHEGSFLTNLLRHA